MQVCINVPGKKNMLYDSTIQNAGNEQDDENDPNNRHDQDETTLDIASSWLWNNASTKLLLDIYKCKKIL